MFENQDNIIQKLRNPMTLASMALDEIQARLGGTRVIADPNSPFCHMLEMNSSIVCDAINAIDEKLPTLYPKRAESMEDLYQHMSDFDYLRMYSTPSSTNISITFPKQYLVAHALEYNANYKKVTIPKDTVFMIGKYPFGMYYPIDILINNFTSTVTASYNTEQSNPLYTLTKNVIEKTEQQIRGLWYVTITFPIFQFAKSVKEVSVVTERGFTTKFVYNNKFYAIRLFGYTAANGYTELSQTQSTTVYDLTKPTALVRVMPDTHEIVVTIPQIYLDNNVIGSRLYVEVYTTLGNLNINTSNLSSTSIGVTYDVESKDSSEFSRIFKNLPFQPIIQLSSDSISGGSDAIDVDTLRDRVVNDTLYEKVPITESDVEVYLKDQNFYVQKSKDNITDRIYYAYRILQDSNGNIIPSITMQMRILESYVNDRSTFRTQSDGSITVLPTTMYQFQSDMNTAIPITTEEMQRIAALEKPALVEELNTNQYFQTPFHIRLVLADRYPSAVSYNLMSPEVKGIIFEAENYDAASKMQVQEALVEHLSQGVGGYDLQISCTKSGDLSQAGISEENDIVVYVAVKSSNGTWIGGRANFDRYLLDRTVYRLHLETNYRLTEANQIALTNLTSDTTQLTEYLVPLESKFYVVFLVRRGAVAGTSGDAPATITQGVPQSYLEGYTAISRQYINISLGHSLDDVIKHEIEISSTQSTYATWDHNVPATYEEDQYARNADGTIFTKVDEEGNLSVVKVASAGDPILDEQGHPVYIHQVGDIRYDPSGEPIVASNRNKVYFINTIFIDSKVFASERTSELDFVQGVYNTLEGYFTTLRELQSQLLERTYIYFRCVRSTGTALFNLGDGVTSHNNIELSFNINCYVPSYVKQNTDIQNQIIELICDAVNEAIKTKELSMMEIFESVRLKMSDYIDHFSLLGVNDSNMQTFVIEDSDAQPSIARKLELSADNVLSLRRQINIEFIALEDNLSSTSSAQV